MAVLTDVTRAATETRGSVEVVLGAADSVETAVSNLRTEVEQFLSKVAV